MEHDEAVRITARQLATALLLNGEADQLWEDFPGIGEHDWERVLEALDGIVLDLRPSVADSDAAYGLLSQLAAQEAEQPGTEQTSLDW